MKALPIALLAAAVAAPAFADPDRYGRVPPGHLPPPGECRVWIDGRPPGQQPPPTSCGRAEARADRYGGRVIYGGDRRRGEYRGYERYDRYDDRRYDRPYDRYEDAAVRVCVRRDWSGRCLRWGLVVR